MYPKKDFGGPPFAVAGKRSGLDENEPPHRAFRAAKSHLRVQGADLEFFKRAVGPGRRFYGAHVRRLPQQPAHIAVGGHHRRTHA